MNNDVQFTGKRHQQKSVDGYNRLPDVFTKEDVMKCFGYDRMNSAEVKLKRLKDYGAVEKIGVVDGKTKYRKKNEMML
jgi:hypothetical protein